MLTGLCGAVAGVATYATLAPQTPTMQQRTLAGGAAAVVGLIIGAAAAALVGQGVTRPALLLMQMAQRLRRGDWQARVSLPGEDELTWVGQELNALATTLQALQEQQEAEQERSQKFRELVRQLRQTQNPQTIMDMAVREVRQCWPVTGCWSIGLTPSGWGRW
jgi:HAMP domain.